MPSQTKPAWRGLIFLMRGANFDHMENWNDYRLILTVSEQKTSRKTAKTLGLSHSTVLRRLAYLQERHGTLFEQFPDGMRPTPLGGSHIDTAREIQRVIADSAVSKTTNSDLMCGPIIVSAPDIIVQHLLMEAFTSFSQKFPDVELHIDTDSAYADLDKAKADIAIRCTDKPLDHLIGRRCVADVYGFYAKREHLSGPTSERSWIAGSEDTDDLKWLKDSPFPQAPVGLRIKGILARYQAAKAGHGMAFLPCFVGDATSDLIRIPSAGLISDRELWVLSHPDSRKVKRVEVLRHALYAALKEQSDLIEGRSVNEIA